ncbi:MAG: hypothetical protein KAU16_05065 [Methanophagales archaeon]|nr:hypothetical protein [Methanophagales archaeon]
MKLLKDERGQLHTIEGLAAAVLMITTVFFVTQGVTVITPQTGLSLDAQLKQSGSDALMVLDTEDPKDGILLKKYVAAWNGTEATVDNPVPKSIDVNSFQFGYAGGNGLNHTLSELLQEDVMYNVDFVYKNGSFMNTSHVIMKGFPPDDSIAVSRLVTLHRNELKYELSELLSNYWKARIPDDETDVKVVEVRLILWYV